VLKELHKYGAKHLHWQGLRSLFNDDKVSLQQAIVKAYTSEAVYREIGQDLVSGNFHHLSSYLSAAVIG